jgi:predicted flap endonuclease-1-like 5' DNA nuclease
MISDAIEYPLEGDDAAMRLVVGGALVLLSPLVIPNLLIGGYSVAVCRDVLDGRPEPPAFDDWGKLAVDGLAVVAISLVYWLPALVVGAIGFGAITIVLFGIGRDPGVLAGPLFMLLAFGGSLLALAYSVLVGYVLPGAVVNYARTDDLSAAWDFGTVRTIVANEDYARAWLIGAGLLFAFSSAASSLVWILVGFPVLFFGQVAAMYVFARGTMDALGIAPEASEGVDATPSESGTSSGESVPGPSDPVTTGRDGDATDGTVGGEAAGEATAGEEDVGPVGGNDTDAQADDEGPEPTDAPGERTLEDVAAIGPTTADALRGAGFETVVDLQAATRAELAAVDSIGPATANRIKSNVEE